MIADVNYTVAGFPMNPSVVFTRCRFPLHLPIFADHALIFSLAKCEFCVRFLFQEVGVFARGCESQLNLAAPQRNMEKHVCSHMERKLIQLNQFVQYVCSIRELQLGRIS